MENLWKDLRYGCRILLKNRGFATVAVLSLALGIGANTAIFSMIKAFVFAPLPVERPDQLISLFTTDQKNRGNLPTSEMNFRDYRDKNPALSGLAAYTGAGVSMANGDEAKIVLAELASGNYFDVLGVKAALGRTFRPDEDAVLGANPVTVISDGLWHRSFGGDKDVIGRTIKLNRGSFTIIGVTPPDFTGTDLGGGPDLWAPIMMHNVLDPTNTFYNSRRGLMFRMIGRLKPEVVLTQAQAAMTALAAQLEQEYPTDNKGRGVKLMPLLQARLDSGGNGQLLQLSSILITVVLVVLLIACANVANLLLARATNRQREIAVRLAIGATRGRLIRQMLTESLLLALIGGGIGILLATWTQSLLGTLDVFGGGPNPPQSSIDWRILGGTILLSLFSGLLFGLVPALQASNLDLVPSLKGESVTTGRRWYQLSWRKLLVVTQVALSLVALVAAGLFIRSLRNVEAVNPGFKTDGVVLLNLSLDREGYTLAQSKVFSKRLLENVSAIPGVQSAAITENPPFAGGFSRSIFLEGDDPRPDRRGVLVQVNSVEVGFFKTLGIPLLRGRDFSDLDQEKTPAVVIVSSAMADKFWPGQDPIGKRFKFFGDNFYQQVIGVAADTKVNSLVEDRLPYIYLPFSQEFKPAFTLVVQSAGDMSSVTTALRTKIRDLDASLPIQNTNTMRDLISLSLGNQQTQSALLTTFGLLALVLAAVGLYGVMSYSVAKRTREIGIRMAIGATTTDVIKLILGQGLAMALVGIAFGLVFALVLARFISTFLFGVGVADPTTFVGVSVILALVAVIASLVPAYRATRINATVALRYD